MTGAMRPFTGRSGANPSGFDTGWTTWTTGTLAGWTIQLRFVDATVWVSINATDITLPAGTTFAATGLPTGPPGAWSACLLQGNQLGLASVSVGGSLIVRNITGTTSSLCQALYDYPLP